jgi:transposase-like protein
MGKGTTPDAEILQFHQDIQTRLRSRIREAIEVVLEEELQLALGAKRYERTSERLGHRNGSERRELTTPDGTRELTVPRGRLFEEGGGTREFESELLPRYQRRMRSVDDAILGTYLGGANTRRIRKALEPLLGSKHLSKSAVSRIVGRPKQLYAE